jgi:Mg2+ and Co2+ transporter CorA
MISKYNHEGLTWIDLESPSEEELTYIMEECYIPGIIEEEIRAKTEETKIKMYSDFIFTSLYFSQTIYEENRTSNNKIIFVACDNFVLTIHDKPILALSEFLKNIELDSSIKDKLEIRNNQILLACLLKSLYVNTEEQLIVSNVHARNLVKKITQNEHKFKFWRTFSIILLVGIMVLLIICL